MTRHTITHSDEIFAGAGQAGGLHNAIRGIPVQLIHRQIIEDPIAGDTNGIIELAGTGAITVGPGELTPLDGVLVDADGVAILDFARNISAASSTTDTTQTLTITGTDIAGNPLVEELLLTGATEAVTASAFLTVTGISIDLAMVGTLIVGTPGTGANMEFGLDAKLLNPYDVIQAVDGAGVAEGGVFTVADTDAPAVDTGDARGTYNPSDDPDGAEDYILYYVADLTKLTYGPSFSG
jgi:hypothetical protein